MGHCYGINYTSIFKIKSYKGQFGIIWVNFDMKLLLDNIIIPMVNFLYLGATVVIHSIVFTGEMWWLQFIFKCSVKIRHINRNIEYISITSLCYYYSLNTFVSLTFFKKSWKVKKSLLGLFVVFTYTEVRQTGGRRGWEYGAGEKSVFLWTSFKGYKSSKCSGRNTERVFEALSVKSLILWWSPN